MQVTINEKRKVYISEKDNTQNENKVTELKLEVPEEYENWNKRIVFITDDGTFWDYIQDDTYLIKKNVTKYERVQFYIWLTNGEQDFRTETSELTFNTNIETDDQIPTEEQIDGFNTLITTLNLEITKVNDKETELNEIIEDLQNKFDTDYFKGEKGDKGEQGIPGNDGQNGKDGIDGTNGQDGKSAYEIWLDEGNEGTEQDFLNSLKGKDGTNGVEGKDGTNGANGQDGFSPIATVDENSTGATISITDKNGTTSVEVKNGTNGKDGTNGTNGQDGYTPVKGIDYWTDADKQEIKQYCDAQIGIIESSLQEV